MNEMRKYINIIESAGDYSKEMRDCVFLYSDHEEGIRNMDADAYNRLDQVFQSEMEKLGKQYLVYRGWCLPSWDDIEPRHDFRNQDIIVFDDYMSTSTDPKIAHSFASSCSSSYGQPVRKLAFLFSIRTHPDARGINTHDFKVNVDKEQEIILNRGSKFRVINKQRKHADWQEDVDEKIEYWVVKLEQIA